MPPKKRKTAHGYKTYLGPDFDSDDEAPRTSKWRAEKKMNSDQPADKGQGQGTSSINTTGDEISDMNVVTSNAEESYIDETFRHQLASPSPGIGCIPTTQPELLVMNVTTVHPVSAADKGLSCLSRIPLQCAANPAASHCVFQSEVSVASPSSALGSESMAATSMDETSNWSHSSPNLPSAMTSVASCRAVSGSENAAALSPEHSHEDEASPPAFDEIEDNYGYELNEYEGFEDESDTPLDEGEPPHDEDQQQENEEQPPDNHEEVPQEGEDQPPNQENAPQNLDQNQDEPGQDDGGNADNNNHGQSHPKLRRRMQGDFDPIIDTAVDVSRNDTLYMALGLARRENFTNTALCNSIKLINTLFNSPILPDTVDALDGLLKSDQYVRYFFFCCQCMKPFGELDYKNLKLFTCPNQNCRTVNFISDLRKAHFFVMFSIPHQLENMLQNPELFNALVSPADALARGKEGFISDLQDGSVYKKLAKVVVNFNGHVFTFHFCVDGSPIADSSLNSIWPLQLALNELPGDLRMSNLLLAGLWFGKKQANMAIFLEPFVTEFQTLSQGFTIKLGNQIQQCYAFCCGCCVDSGARGKVQGIKKHSGYNSCNWCIIQGEWIGGAVKFPIPLEPARDRTHEELEAAQRGLVDNPVPEEEDDELLEDPGIPEAERHLLGANAVSPLINLPHVTDQEGATFPSFNIVEAFFVDAMHLLDLGIGKFFLSRWLEDYGYEYYIKPSENEIDRRIKSVHPPLELRRQPRPLYERARYTARELHNWRMYFCYPILFGILPRKFLNHWLLLIQALYFLDLSEVSVVNVEIADSLIRLFLSRTQQYYDRGDMVFNLHILSHLAAHVLRHGPLWASCAYCFEDGNGRMKRLVHSNQGVPHQIIRALSWSEAMKVLEPTVSDKAKQYVADITTPKNHRKISFAVGDVRLIGKPENLNLSDEEVFQCELSGHVMDNLKGYPKIVYKNCCYTDNGDRSSVSDNSIAQLTDKTLVLIRRIIFDSEQDKVFLLVSDVLFDTVLVPPPGIIIKKEDHFMRKITHINEEVKYINYSDLKIICCRATMPSGDYVAPLPNVHNRQ